MGSPTRGATSLLIQAQARLTGENPNLPKPEQGGSCGQQGQHCADHQADPLLQRHLPLRLILRLEQKILEGACMRPQEKIDSHLLIRKATRVNLVVVNVRLALLQRSVLKFSLTLFTTCDSSRLFST